MHLYLPFARTSSTMDRLSLLEQKRARLQQLKQRRLTLETSLAVHDIIERHSPLPERKVVLVAVQTDTPHPEAPASEAPSAEAPPLRELEVPAFDKAIQTEPLKPPPPEEPAPPPPPPASPPPPPEPRVVYLPDPDPPSQFARFLAQRAPPTAVHGEGALRIEVREGGMRLRRAVAVDFSPHYPELAAVAFGAKSRPAPGDAAGVVVVYNHRTMVPQFLLHALAPLSAVRFDRVDTRTVFGGCSVGTVVAWDLADSPAAQVAIDPSLSTPYAGPGMEAGGAGAPGAPAIDYVPHRQAVVALHQYTRHGHNVVVLVLADGVVNAWLPQLLAWPKYDSAVVATSGATAGLAGTGTSAGPSASTSAPTVGGTPLVVAGGTLVGGGRAADSTPDLAPDLKRRHYLNLVVVAGVGGTVAVCDDDPHHHYVREAAAGPDGALAVVAMLDALVVTAHLDLLVCLWRVSALGLERVHSVVARCCVVRVCVRPHHPGQFVAVGVARGGRQVVEVWDWRRRARTAVTAVLGFAEPVISALGFDAEGAVLVVGFDTGEVAKVVVDDAELAAAEAQKPRVGRDDGLAVFT